MKIKVPSVKKNKKEAQPEGQFFDMTGGTDAAGNYSAAIATSADANASAPAKKTFGKKIGARAKIGAGRTVFKGIGKGKIRDESKGTILGAKRSA